jgi:hypothetical protein
MNHPLLTALAVASSLLAGTAHAELPDVSQALARLAAKLPVGTYEGTSFHPDFPTDPSAPCRIEVSHFVKGTPGRVIAVQVHYWQQRKDGTWTDLTDGNFQLFGNARIRGKTDFGIEMIEHRTETCKVTEQGEVFGIEYRHRAANDPSDEAIWIRNDRSNPTIALKYGVYNEGYYIEVPKPGMTQVYSYDVQCRGLRKVK